MQYKILIVGVGSIGTRHLKNLLFLGQKNISVCDPSEEKLRGVSDLGQSNLYKNLKVALKKEQPDIVFVCNPTHLHVPTASLALDYGAHLFIEKPLSHNLKGVDALIKKAKAKKVVAMVACNFRFNRGFKELEKNVKSGIFGKPITAFVAGGSDLKKSRKGVDYRKTYAASSKHGGGVILDSGSHAVEYLSAILGKPIGLLSSVKKNIGGLGISAEDFVSKVLEFDSGAVATVVADYFSVPKKHFMEVQCEKGRFIWRFAENTVEALSADADKSWVKAIYKKSETDNARNDMYVDELRHFMYAVKHKKHPLQDLNQAKEITKVLLAAKNKLNDEKKIR